MKFAFVPVRGGSKSIPLKNIKELCGKPLVFWNLYALENSKHIEEIHVSTDSQDITDVVNSFGFKKVKIHKRSDETSSDTASTESAMLEFLDQNNFDDEDLFILVQATSPFTQTDDFDTAICQFDDNDADSMLTCVKTSRFYWDADGKPINYDHNNRQLRQSFGGTFMENGAFYINSVGNIKKYKNRLSGKVSIYEMPEYTGVELDEDHDWVIAEELMRRYILDNKN